MECRGTRVPFSPHMPKFCFAALALVVALPAFAQFQEKVDVNYIEVPVTVVGRDGGSVRGLTQENFEVYDNGQKRTIESFDAIDFTAPDILQSVSPLNPASRRNFLILFDLSFSTPISISRAQEAARNFVARSVGRRDLVGVAVIDIERGFRFLTAFTTDRNLLSAAIKDPNNFRAFDPLQISGHMASSVFDTTGGGASHAGDISARNSNARDAAEDVAADLKRSVLQADDSYRRSRVQKQVEVLRTVARTMQKLAGRKHVVLLSEGFDPRLVQGRTASEQAEQDDENRAIASGEVWKVDSDRRYGHAGVQQDIRRMADEFRRADAVLHAVDIQGVRVQNDIRTGAKVNSNDGLFILANATNGEVFRNTNDINKDFDRLLRQHDVVYVLGFRAPSGKPGQAHDLKVKLVGVPGARVAHRDGYYDSGNESTVERSLSTAEIILSDIPQNDLDVAALAAPFPKLDGNAQVPVILEVRGTDLVAAARNDTATVDIFVYAFDDTGLVRDSVYQRVQFELAKAGDKLRAAGMKFYGTLNLEPGKYVVKTLVRVAESDKKTYRRLDVDVPAGGDVAVLQPMFFADAGDWVMVKAESKAKTKAPYPFVLNGETFIPAARATLRRGVPRNFTVWVWNAKPDELAWEIAPQARLVSQTEGDVMTKLVFTLEQVPPGAEELGVTIRKKGSTDERRVSVPIRIQ